MEKKKIQIYTEVSAWGQYISMSATKVRRVCPKMSELYDEETVLIVDLMPSANAIITGPFHLHFHFYFDQRKMPFLIAGDLGSRKLEEEDLPYEFDPDYEPPHKDENKEPEKGLWRMVLNEVQNLVSLILLLLLLGVLGSWQYLLWIFFHATLFFLKEKNGTLAPLSFRKRLKNFLEVYSQFVLRNWEFRKWLYRVDPPLPLFNYLKFICFFFIKYKWYSGMLIKSKRGKVILLILAAVYGVFGLNQVAMLPLIIKIPILIAATVNFYWRLYKLIEEEVF